jgi:hypothetical protein
VCFTLQQRNETQQQQQSLQSPQQQQRVLDDEHEDAASSSDASSDDSGDAPRTDVATDVAADVSSWQLQWQLQADTSHFLDKLLRQLKPADAPSDHRLENVDHVLAALQRCIVYTDERSSTCAKRLKLSLQRAYANKTEQQCDADVILLWIREQRRDGSEARHHLKLVSCTCLLMIVV